MNKEANRRMKKWCLEQGITRCENCGQDWALSFAHKQKRRYYSSAEELSDPKEFLLLCLKCHQQVEYDKKLTRDLFNDLRGGLL